MTELQALLDFIQAVWRISAPFVGAFITLALLSLRKIFVSQVKFDELKQQHFELKSKVDSLPSQKELHDLKVALEYTNGELKELRAALKPLDRLANLLLEQELKDR